MTNKCPPNRRTFQSDWDVIGYLYHKILYWFYRRRDRRQALRFCDRLRRVLKRASPNHEAIFGEECWSLVYEVEGNLLNAIKHRENEIRLIQRLHEISLHTPSKDFVLERYDYSDLSDRLDLLAVLYHEVGDLDKAISVLHESKRLCTSNRIRFDGEDLLHDYLSVKREVARQHADFGNSERRRKLA